jgi:hypothetical protein
VLLIHLSQEPTVLNDEKETNYLNYTRNLMSERAIDSGFYSLLLLHILVCPHISFRNQYLDHGIYFLYINGKFSATEDFGLYKVRKRKCSIFSKKLNQPMLSLIVALPYN